MAFDDDKLDRIYERTDGHCHICRKKLARSNYGNIGARGAWEVEHSRPRSMGGTDHGNNLYAACISCNRSKGNSSTASARSRNGYKTAPYSRARKDKNAWFGAGSFGALAFILAPPQIKIPVVILSAVIGGAIGANAEPD
jgi:5-methylcytosine-specific restriction endonuclease McrA